jgi:glucose-6-phosphate 1-epimerase/putative transcriptional regulator
MALKVTDNLARLILFGAFSSSSMDISAGSKTHLLIKFMLAFGQECAVYIGGPDAQDQPAVMIHGHADLPGAVELASGTNLFRGGSLDAAMDGVLWGKYRPMDFRFFVGRHDYKEHLLDVAVVLGKYQPVACARSLALKQCISLPKPLWHEGQ